MFFKCVIRYIFPSNAKEKEKGFIFISPLIVSHILARVTYFPIALVSFALFVLIYC